MPGSSMRTCTARPRTTSPTVEGWAVSTALCAAAKPMRHFTRCGFAGAACVWRRPVSYSSAGMGLAEDFANNSHHGQGLLRGGGDRRGRGGGGRRGGGARGGGGGADPRRG